MEQPQTSSPVQGQQQHNAAPTQPAPAQPVPQQPRASYLPQQQAAAQPFQQPAPYYAYQPAPRVVPFSKNWYWGKMGLAIASVVFAVIALGLALGLAMGPRSNVYATGFEYIVIPLVIACVVWDLVVLISVCTCLARHRRASKAQQSEQGQQQQPQDNSHPKGVHPGASVGVDLVLWLGGLVTLLFSLSFATSYGYEDYVCEDDYYRNSSYYRGYYDEYCNEEAAAVRRGVVQLGRALVAFICLLTLTHFIVFVRACVETNQRNRMRGPVIMVPAQHLSMYMAPPQQPGVMPMMPPHTYMASGHQGASPVVNNEKAAATANPQAHAAPTEGFYAPNPPTASHAGQAV
ncbi:hypothetical protein PG996_004476 [Apiospora saccharicola]|uniref:MARVEL domain-containing protein n=1 Tax=Apiospora saccharicola TaxID=335842 RepID=A0ABR1W6Y7_9PEZI